MGFFENWFGGNKQEEQNNMEEAMSQAEMEVVKSEEANGEDGYDSGVKFEDLSDDYDPLKKLDEDIEKLGKEGEMEEAA